MNKITATILALLILLPMASAAINVGTGAIPSEPERALSVKVLSFGDNAMICVNCPELTTAPEPGLMQATNAERFPRIICKGDTPCVIYTGLKYKENYNPASGQQFPFIIATKDAYKKDKPLIASSGQNVGLEDVERGELILDAENKKIYTIDMMTSSEVDPEGTFKNVYKLILVNAKVYINNLPEGTEAPLEGTLSEAEQERAEDITVSEEEKGQILKIRGLDKRAPNQLIDKLSIPLKKGDTITFKGLFGEQTYGYHLDAPVLNVGRFTDNEDDSTAEDENAGDWLDELDNKFLDSDKDRSELKICNQKFTNYYAGSSFEILANAGRCTIPRYVLNTELFEEDDADDNKLFQYVCGDIVFEAVGGNARNLYCDQRETSRAELSCGKNGLNELCTGVQGKTKMKIRIEPGAFDIDNKEGYMFKSIKETTIGQQKAYEFLTGKLKIRTHPQSENPLRFDLILGVGEKPFVITYKDDKALGTSTITMPENTIVSRRRSAQIFSYHLKQADYKGVLGEGLHQINLIFPSGLERNDENTIKLSEAKTRGATRDDIALLGAVAEEAIEISSPETHLYSVTPIQPGQEATTGEAQTITPQATAASATTLGAYAYRHCFARNPPASFIGAERAATERIASAILETNRDKLTADTTDILNTRIPAGTVLNLPGVTTTYKLGNALVRVRVNTQGCFGLTAPAIQGGQCMEKPGAVVKCVPTSRQSQCTTVYQEGNGVKGCAENNVCCEVRLAHSAEYCVLPERGAFMADGAKCKVTIGCRTEVSSTDYSKINTERTSPCAEGLSCCKQARSSAAETSARTGAAVRDDSECRTMGGTCDDIRNNFCENNEGTASLSFIPLKCHSNRASWYQCCVGRVSSKQTTEITPLSCQNLAESIDSTWACRTENCNANEREITKGRIALCSNSQKCCMPTRATPASTVAPTGAAITCSSKAIPGTKGTCTSQCITDIGPAGMLHITSGDAECKSKDITKPFCCGGVVLSSSPIGEELRQRMEDRFAA